MSSSDGHRDPWAIPALFMWLVFLLVGMAVEPVYTQLRAWSGVATLNAFVTVSNSLVLSVVFAGYFARFAYLQGREARPRIPALDRFSQIGLLCFIATVAFWWMPYEVALSGLRGEINPDLDGILKMYVVSGVYGAALIKTVCWLYLVSLVVRYYALGDREVFGTLFGVGRGESEEERPAERAENVVEWGNGASDWEESGADARKKNAE